MKLKNIGPAVVIAVGLLATAVIPMGISQAVGQTTENVPSGHTEDMIQSDEGISFTAPEGWEQHLDTNPKAETYTQGGRTLRVSYNSGVTVDADVAHQRAAEALTRAGYATTLKDDAVSTAHGLEGKACTTVAAEPGQAGDCALLLKDGVEVSVVSIAEGDEQPANLQPILDSLQVSTPDDDQDEEN